MLNYPLSDEQLKKCIAAFRDGRKTTLSLIVVNQAYEDNNIKEYKGDNAYELSEKLADKYLSLLDFTTGNSSDDDLKEAIKGYYDIIFYLLQSPD